MIYVNWLTKKIYSFTQKTAASDVKRFVNRCAIKAYIFISNINHNLWVFWSVDIFRYSEWAFPHSGKKTLASFKMYKFSENVPKCFSPSQTLKKISQGKTCKILYMLIWKDFFSLIYILVKSHITDLYFQCNKTVVYAVYVNGPSFYNDSEPFMLIFKISLPLQKSYSISGGNNTVCIQGTSFK